MDIGAAATRFKDVVEFGFTQLTTAVIKPRIKPQIDIFLSTSHNLSDVSGHLSIYFMLQSFMLRGKIIVSACCRRLLKVNMNCRTQTFSKLYSSCLSWE